MTKTTKAPKIAPATAFAVIVDTLPDGTPAFRGIPNGMTYDDGKALLRENGAEWSRRSGYYHGTGTLAVQAAQRVQAHYVMLEEKAKKAAKATSRKRSTKAAQTAAPAPVAVDPALVAAVIAALQAQK